MLELKFARRSVAMAIILSIITCGIYALYWLYQILVAYYRATGQRSSAGLDILLCFVTCGIYFIYLMYKIGKLESQVYFNMGWQKDDSILYLILAIFGLSLITYAIIQSNINYLANFDDDSGGGPGGGRGWTPPGGPTGSGGNGTRPPDSF